MDMDNYDGPMVAVLVRNILSGPPIVDSAHPDEDEAHHYLGREICAGMAPLGVGWEVVMVPAPLLVQREAGESVTVARNALRAAAAQDDEHQRRQMATALDPRHADLSAPSWVALRNAVRELCRELELCRDRELKLTRLVGDDPERVQLDTESLERALRAHWDAHRVSEAWENAPAPTQERELRAVERIVKAYLTDPEDG